ncbi:MAG: hypothetical protein ABSB29_08295 [Nitrososphaerales archaeon]
MAPLQIGVTDLVSLLIENPLTFSLIILFISGYVFLAVSSRRTLLWKETSPSERLLIGIAISAGLEPIFFLITLGVYHFFGTRLDLSTAIVVSSIASSTVLVLSSLGLKAGGTADHLIRKSLSSLTLLFIYLFAVLTGFFIGLSFLSAVFPSGATQFFLPYLVVNATIWFLAGCFAVIFYFVYTGLYSERLHSYLYLGNTFPPTSPFKYLGIEHRSLRTKVLILGVISLLVGSAGVAADNKFSILVPGTQTIVAPSTIPSYLSSQRLSYVFQILSRSSLGYQNASEVCNIKSYQPFNDTVTFRVPALSVFSVDNFSLQNPSKVSNYSANSYSLNIPPWQQLVVDNSNHARISFAPSTANAQTLYIGFKNLSRGSTFDVRLRYFQPAYPAVTCTETDTYVKSHGTELVRHIFEIRNGQSSALGLHSVILRDFSGLGIYASNITVSIDGQTFNGFGFVNFDEVDLNNHIVPANVNLTLMVEGVSKVP